MSELTPSDLKMQTLEATVNKLCVDMAVQNKSLVDLQAVIEKQCKNTSRLIIVLVVAVCSFGGPDAVSSLAGLLI